MTRFSKIVEWVYVGVFILSAFEVYSKWNTDRDRAQLFILFGVVAIGMFFFRRYFRKKLEKRNQQK